MLEGRRTAAYPALEPDVTAAGAEYVDGAAVVDGVMVSARAWPDHPAWMREFIRLLREHAPAEPAPPARRASRRAHGLAVGASDRRLTAALRRDFMARSIWRFASRS